MLVTSSSKNDLRTDSHLTNQQTSKSIVPCLNVPMAHICSNSCVWCTSSFALYDKPNHIGHIKNIDKQNSFLKMKSFLEMDSCLCDGCWKFLERTYNFNKKKKRGVSSGPNDVDRNFEPSTTIKPITKCSEKLKTRNVQIFFCSVHNCRQEFGLHPLSLNEYIKINKILLKADIHTIILIKSQKWGSNQHGPISLSVCEEHFNMINVLTTCQLCGNELGTNLDTNYWNLYDQWNCTLKCNNIPLKLLPGMCLCDTCQSFISNSVLFPTIDLESLRKNVKNRNYICMKLFERPESDKKKTNKLGDLLKVHFAKPITSTYYYTCNIDSHLLKKRKKKLHCFKRSIDSKIKPDANIDSGNSEITPFNLINIKDKLLPSIDENINNNKDNNASSRIEIIDISFSNDIKFKFDPVSTNIEEKTNLVGLKKYPYHISSESHNIRPNFRVRKLMNLVKKDDNVNTEKTSSVLPDQNKECSPLSLIRHSADVVLSTIDNHSDENFTKNQNARTTKIDDKKDLLQSPLSSVLDTYNNMPTVSCAISQLNDKTVCKKTDQHNQLITNCIPFAESNIDVCNISDEETEHFSELLSQQNDDDDQSKSSCDSEYLTEDSNFEKKDSNELGHGTKVLVSKRSRNLKVNPTEINKRLCGIFNKLTRTKKQKLNDTHINQATSSLLDNCIKDSFIESNRHGSINNKTSNSPCALNLLSLKTNENILNLDHKNVDDQNMSCNKDKQTTMPIDLDDILSISSDEYEEIIVTNNPAILQSIPHDEDEETIMSNESIIDVQNISSDECEEIIVTNDLANLKSLACDEDEDTIMSNDSIIDVQNISGDDEIMKSNDSDWINHFYSNELNADESLFYVENDFSSKSLQLKQTLKTIPALTDKTTSSTNENNTVGNETESDYEISSGDETSSGINQFSCLFKGKPYSKHKNNKNKDFYKLHFDLDNCNEQIYKDLLARFNSSSAVFSYLMENERLLFNEQLVLSDNPNPYVTNYIKKHLDALSTWYGDSKDHDLSESFISPSNLEARLYSQRLSPDISDLSESEETNVDVCLSPASLEKNSLSFSTSSIDSFINHVPQVQKDIPSLTYSSFSVDSSINCVPEDLKNVTSATLSKCIPNVSSVKLNPLPPAPRKSLPSSVCFTPKLNVCQRQPVPYFQSPTAVRSKAFIPRGPLSLSKTNN